MIRRDFLGLLVVVGICASVAQAGSYAYALAPESELGSKRLVDELRDEALRRQEGRSDREQGLSGTARLPVELGEILRDYDLGPLAGPPERLEGMGTHEGAWRIHTQRGVFTIKELGLTAGTMPSEAARFEVQWRRHLAGKGFAGEPVAKREGIQTWEPEDRYIHRGSDKRLRIVSRFVEGEPIGQTPEALEGPEGLVRLAARYHAAAEDFAPRYRREATDWVNAEEKRRDILALRDHLLARYPHGPPAGAQGAALFLQHADFLLEQLEILEQELPPGRWEGLPVVPVHGDIHPGNAIQPAQDGPLQLVDWDLLGMGPRIADLANGMFPLEIPGKRGRFNLVGLGEAVRDYAQAGGVLTDEEIEALPEIFRAKFLHLLSFITDYRMFVEHRGMDLEGIPAMERGVEMLDREASLRAWYGTQIEILRHLDRLVGSHAMRHSILIAVGREPEARAPSFEEEDIATALGEFAAVLVEIYEGLIDFDDLKVTKALRLHLKLSDIPKVVHDVIPSEAIFVHEEQIWIGFRTGPEGPLQYRRFFGLARPEDRPAAARVMAADADGRFVIVSDAVGEDRYRDERNIWLDKLVTLATSPDTVPGMGEAGDELEVLRDPYAVEKLLGRLRAPTAWLARIHIPALLASMGVAEAVPALISVLEEERNFLLRKASVMALGKIGDARALGVLRDVWERPLLEIDETRPLIEQLRAQGMQGMVMDAVRGIVTQKPLRHGDGEFEELGALVYWLRAMKTETDLREHILLRLGELGDLRALPAIAVYLGHPGLGEIAQGVVLRFGEDAIEGIRDQVRRGIRKGAGRAAALRVLVMLGDRETAHDVAETVPWNTEMILAMKYFYRVHGKDEVIARWLGDMYLYANGRIFPTRMERLWYLLWGADAELSDTARTALRDLKLPVPLLKALPALPAGAADRKRVFGREDFDKVEEALEPLIAWLRAASVYGATFGAFDSRVQALAAIVSDEGRREVLKARLLRDATAAADALVLALRAEEVRIRDFAFEVLGHMPADALEDSHRRQIADFQKYRDDLQAMRKVLMGPRPHDLVRLFDRMAFPGQVIGVARHLADGGTIERLAWVMASYAEGRDRELFGKWLMEMADVELVRAVLRMDPISIEPFEEDALFAEGTLARLQAAREAAARGDAPEARDLLEREVTSSISWPAIWTILADVWVPWTFKARIAEAVDAMHEELEEAAAKERREFLLAGAGTRDLFPIEFRRLAAPRAGVEAGALRAVEAAL